MKKEADDPEKEKGDPLAASISAGMLGLGIFIGGVVYGYTAEKIYLILSLAVPVVLIGLLFRRVK